MADSQYWDQMRRYGVTVSHETRRLAKSLHALGVRRHDKVALIMGNQVEWLLVLFGNCFVEPIAWMM